MADRPVDFSDDSGFSLLYEGSLFPDGRAEVFVFPDGQSGVPDSCRRAGSWGKDCAAKVFLRMHKPESDAKTQTGVQAQAHPAARSLSNLDIAMLCYLAAIFVSWLFSVDRAAAWTGTDGWSMGLRTQVLLVLMYFLVSRYLIWWKGLLAVHMLASGGVFLLGILHRFSIDPLGMYQGLDES
mgnify:FL=1